MVTTVFGLGFVGLTTALGFAELGHKVFGVDVDAARLEKIRNGTLPFLEPGMDEALTRHLGKKFFPISPEELASAIAESDCVYYCVGTPYGKDGQADLKYLFTALEQTITCTKDEKFRVLVTKSTIPPSTTQEKILPFLRERGVEIGTRFGVANNPEFLREGHCWDDFLNADRIVLGVSDARSENVLRALYAPLGAPVFCVSLNTGEFIKYLSNTLLATLISYSNEMSLVADAIGGIDVAQAFRILHMDKRWGGCNMTTYAYPGCGYGGYCLPKDTNALYAVSRSFGFSPEILGNVIRVNDAMPEFMAKRILKLGGEKVRSVGILGLSFKPGSDDVRDAPSAKIIRALLANGVEKIFAYDPVANAEFAARYPDLPIEYCKTKADVLSRADIVAVATAWQEFKDVRELSRVPVADCRYML